MSLSREEETLLKGSYSEVIGIDEAGRGPLAGPVVAASCIILDGLEIEGILDSKATTESQREEAYTTLTSHPSVVWAVSVVSHQVIDEINILQATLQAMRDSCKQVLNNLKKKKTKKNFLDTNMIALIDGNKVPDSMPIDSKFVIKGDSFVFSIAAASIIAKVTRDRLMVGLDKQFPAYGFAKHKGYPTADHRAALHKYGPSAVHRLSYAPVKESLQLHAVKQTDESHKEALCTPTTTKRKRPLGFDDANLNVTPPSRPTRAKGDHRPGFEAEERKDAFLTNKKSASKPVSLRRKLKF